MLINNVFQCTQENFDKAKSTSYITLKCSICNDLYQRKKKNILDNFLKNNNQLPIACSFKCIGVKKLKHEQKLFNVQTVIIILLKILNRLINTLIVFVILLVQQHLIINIKHMAQDDPN